jgi:hypothetical protein
MQTQGFSGHLKALWVPHILERRFIGLLLSDELKSGFDEAVLTYLI